MLEFSVAKSFDKAKHDIKIAMLDLQERYKLQYVYVRPFLDSDEED